MVDTRFEWQWDGIDEIDHLEAHEVVDITLCGGVFPAATSGAEEHCHFRRLGRLMLNPNGCFANRPLAGYLGDGIAAGEGNSGKCLVHRHRRRSFSPDPDDHGHVAARSPRQLVACDATDSVRVLIMGSHAYDRHGDTRAVSPHENPVSGTKQTSPTPTKSMRASVFLPTLPRVGGPRLIGILAHRSFRLIRIDPGFYVALANRLYRL